MQRVYGVIATSEKNIYRPAQQSDTRITHTKHKDWEAHLFAAGGIAVALTVPRQHVRRGCKETGNGLLC